MEMLIIDDKLKLVIWRNFGSCLYNIVVEVSKFIFFVIDVIWLKKNFIFLVNGIFMFRLIVN